MLIGDDIELVEGLPVMYIRSMRALVVSDLHLGYEGGMAKSGIAIPKVNLRSVIDTLQAALRGRMVERLIITGDIKNDFSGVLGEEINELREIVATMAKEAVAVELVKGNHDNFIESYSRSLGIRVHNEQLVVGTYLFAHGDKQPSKAGVPISTLIMGHEHPSIAIRSKAGTVERLRCFLYGKVHYSGKKVDLIVLPAIGYFETGSDINFHAKGRIMSPLLKKAGVDKMVAIAVGHGSTLSFGKVEGLRSKI